jgi:hypothetical protein
MQLKTASGLHIQRIVLLDTAAAQGFARTTARFMLLRGGIKSHE